MADTKKTSSQTPNTALADMLRRLHNELRIITQATCSMGAAVKELNPMEYKRDVICPELVLPLLIKAAGDSTEECYQILDELGDLLQTPAAARGEGTHA